MLDVLPPGTILGGEFVVVRPLDEGGMGAVYVVEQRSTAKTRALKVMHREIAADPALQRRFEQEARVGSRIKSDHVVDVVAAGVDEVLHLPYLVMELLDGEDLRTRIDARGALPHDEVCALFEQICHALAAAHAAGIVHRDIKPENIFVARAQRAGGGPFTVKVLDFGIAKVTAEAGTKATRGAVGSPLWMAPEQTQPGPVTPAADVWALGLLAFELLTGRRFWRAANEADGTTAQLLREIVLDPIPIATARASEQGVETKLPKGFDVWMSRCVRREPAGRYPDAGSAWHAMKRMFDGAPVDAEAFALDETGEAAPYAIATSAPPAGMPPRLRPETPIVSTHDPSPPVGGAPAARASRLPIVIGAAIAAGGIAIALGVPRGAFSMSDTVTVNEPPPARATAAAPSASPAIAGGTASAPVSRASASEGAPSPLPPAPPSAVAAPTAKPTSTSPVAPPTKRTIAGGFGDPEGYDGTRKPVMWKVQGKQVRLLTRLASNESNVADAVVKKAIEWNAWQYLRCYERYFGGAKDMPEGVVTVSFEIIDQLPRHAKVESSTFASAAMTDCVRSTLVGQTINAAGPDGTGKATHAFRFVPVD